MTDEQLDRSARRAAVWLAVIIAQIALTLFVLVPLAIVAILLRLVGLL